MAEYPGDHAYIDILQPWLAGNGPALAAMLGPLAMYGEWARYAGPPLRAAESFARSDESEFQPREDTALALSRLADAMRVTWSPENGPPSPELRSHYHAGHHWPRVSLDDYLAFFAAVGMRSVVPTTFDPVQCEIVEVVQAPDVDAPIDLVEVGWPALMLGEMVFSRAGVRVRAGRHSAAAGIADRTPMYWSHLRRHRPAVDVTSGFGHGSDWYIPFRRDYITPYGIHLNIGAAKPERFDELPEPEEVSKEPAGDRDPTSQLTRGQRLDMLLHRCLIRDLEPGQPADWLGYIYFLIEDWTLTLPAPTPPAAA